MKAKAKPIFIPSVWARDAKRAVAQVDIRFEQAVMHASARLLARGGQ